MLGADVLCSSMSSRNGRIRVLAQPPSRDTAQPQPRLLAIISDTHGHHLAQHHGCGPAYFKYSSSRRISRVPAERAVVQDKFKWSLLQGRALVGQHLPKQVDNDKICRSTTRSNPKNTMNQIAAFYKYPANQPCARNKVILRIDQQIEPDPAVCQSLT